MYTSQLYSFFQHLVIILQEKILYDKNHIEFFTVYFALPFLNQSTRPRPSPTTPKMVRKRPACSPVAGRRAFFLALDAGGVGSSVVVGVGTF